MFRKNKDILSLYDFRKRDYKKSDLIEIASNNNGICIEAMDYHIMYNFELDKFEVVYDCMNNIKSIVDYQYIIEHFR